MKRKSMLIALLLVLAGPSSQAQIVNTPYDDSSVEFSVQKVPNAPVYYVIGQSGVPGAGNEGMTSNAGFVITKKGVVVYDALGTPALGYRLLSHIRQLTDKPVTIVVAGHYHADHIYGLQAFREHTRAEIWAQKDAASYFNSTEAQTRLTQRREALFPWITEKTYIVKPDNTFSDRHSFDMGDTSIELIHAGPAHAPDDVIMVVHQYGVIFSGDLVFSGRLPFLGGAQVNTGRWLKGLDYLQQLKPAPRFVIPGHGQADSNPADAIEFTRGYIDFLRAKMGEAANDLIPFDEVYSKTDWSAYKNVPTFEAANRGNAYQVYLEMQSNIFN